MNKTTVLLLALIILTVASTVIATPASSTEAKENSWTAKAAMPEAICEFKSAVVNGKIYAMTGSANYEYDPSKNVWTTKKPMPTSRDSFGMASCQGKIYVMGGENGNGAVPNYLSTNEVYDPLTDSWETKKPMPTARDYLEANAVNGKIYTVGGRAGTYSSVETHTNEVYDPSSDSWASKKPAPIGVIKGASAVVDKKIYILGGVGDNETLNGISNQIYDTEADTWSFGASLPALTVYAAAGATTGVLAPKRIYVTGGGFTEITNVVNVYNPSLDSWSSGAPLPTNRTGHAVAVVNDLLYAMGGGETWHGGMPPTPYSGWTLTNVVEQYSPIGYGAISPVISVFSPENKTYNASIVALAFTIDRTVSWMQYSLDGNENVTITGNTTLIGLSNGRHNLIVYAKYDEGNIGVSEYVAFGIDKPEPESFPAALIVGASGLLIAGVSLFLVYRCLRRSRGS